MALYRATAGDGEGAARTAIAFRPLGFGPARKARAAPRNRPPQPQAEGIGFGLGDFAENRDDRGSSSDPRKLREIARRDLLWIACFRRTHAEFGANEPGLYI